MPDASVPTPNLHIAEVVFDLSLDKRLEYNIPPELLGKVQVGSRVIAPLKTQKKAGYILALKAKSDFPKLRDILALDDQARQIPENLLRLAVWMANYYCCPWGPAVWTLLPAAVRRGDMKHLQVLYVTLTQKAMQRSDEYEKLTEKQKAVLQALQRVGSLPHKELLGLVDAGEGVISKLCETGWLTKEKQVVERDPFRNLVLQTDKPRRLTFHQGEALKEIIRGIDGEDRRPMVLHGVTGSGKTEVYLQAIAHCLELGKQAIVLVPEISLTPQTCDRFRARFGDQVSVLHSGLSDGERFDEWMRLNEGRTSIAVGARSALFAPFRKLGLIVVDEEHENSYKQDEAPRYNARDVAVVRAKFEGAAVLLGSATPSLESLYNCEQGRYRRLVMPERVDGQPMPSIEFVDMSQEAERGALFSQRLVQQVRKTLEEGKQIILFLNRRGYASQLVCSLCGYTAMCPNCSIAFTYHKKQGTLLCHLCGEEIPAPQDCPSCHNPDIRYAGFGTERIESTARALFPTAIIARMDSDTMTTRDSYRQVLDAFRAGKINMLIGTQMIAKGLDFPNVTLVGLLQADIGLNQPDFRSAERTFQLITQVAGRAGRGEFPGKVIVQTYSQFHYALQAAREQDCKRFYDEDMPARKELDFPPYSHMVLITFRSKVEEDAKNAAIAFAENIQPLLPPAVQTIGPMPAPLSLLKTFFRFQLSLRGGDIRKLLNAIKCCQADFHFPKKIEMAIDVDPRSLS